MQLQLWQHLHVLHIGMQAGKAHDHHNQGPGTVSTQLQHSPLTNMSAIQPAAQLHNTVAHPGCDSVHTAFAQHSVILLHHCAWVAGQLEREMH